MEINRDAPATADGELRIDADPQTVFSVIAAIDRWPSWNPDVKSVTVPGPVQPGTVFRWKSGPSTLTSTLQVVDPPHEIAWTGTTMGIRKVVRMALAKGSWLPRRPSAASVPSTVATMVAPEPMIRLLTIERRHTSLSCNSANQREEKVSIG